MPRWSLAQPFRQIAHNGEINTIRGNVNWMVSRALAAGADMGAVAAGCSSDDPDRSCEFVDPDQLGAVVDASKSDSANLDALLELYTRAGRTVDESLLLMMPPAIPKKEEKLFFDLHAPLQEASDGPAAACYSNGDVVGEVNGTFTNFTEWRLQNFRCELDERGVYSESVKPRFARVAPSHPGSCLRQR